MGEIRSPKRSCPHHENTVGETHGRGRKGDFNLGVVQATVARRSRSREHWRMMPRVRRVESTRGDVRDGQFRRVESCCFSAARQCNATVIGRRRMDTAIIDETAKVFDKAVLLSCAVMGGGETQIHQVVMIYPSVQSIRE